VPPVTPGARPAQTAAAAGITVLSGGAVEPGLKAAATVFEKETGHTVQITFNTAPQILERLGAGDIFNVVIAPPAVIEELAKAGKVERERVSIGRVGMGVGIREGAPVPDISSVEAIRRTVLEAESVVFNRASSGLHFEGLLQRMGIYEQIEPKTARYPDAASVMERLLRGKGKEVGFGPMTKILQYKDRGLRLIGPLPAEVQHYTSYIAVEMTGVSNKAAAGAFLRFLGGPTGKPLFSAAGIE
jgi:molybdate transport system substrate-binding protein